MKKDHVGKVKNGFGQSLEMTGMTAVNFLESGISEGFHPSSDHLAEAKNIFGRPLLSPDCAAETLSFSAGLSLTGLRAAALIDGSTLLNSQNQLISSARRRLSYVLHLILPDLNHLPKSTETGHVPYHAISDTGLFQLFASNPQEALDLCLIAHKIAEYSLIPGICAMDGHTANNTQEVVLPDKQMIRAFLGDADDQISSPTPSQQMIFGETRRRIPNWFNFDYPTANGVEKDAHALTLEIAAQKPYFFDHLPHLAKQVMAEFSQLTGRAYTPVSGYQIEDAEYVILAQGSALNSIISVVDDLRSTRKVKVGCLKLTMFRPFPGHLLAHLLAEKKGITVLERVSEPFAEDPPLFRELSTALGKAVENASRQQKVYPDYPIIQKGMGPTQYCGYYGLGGLPLTQNQITACFENMFSNGEGKRRFFSGVDFVHQRSDYPKHEILLQNIQREYPQVKNLSLSESSSQPHVENPEAFSPAELPLAVRQYKDHGPPYSRLSRFFDQTDYFYQSGQQEELVADPFQAVPTTPPATANCHDMSPGRTEIPKFLSPSCTGCGQCYIHCPHSAIPPLVIHLEALIKSAGEMAAARGNPITQLTPAVKNLAKLANRFLRDPEKKIGKVADILPPAFDQLVEQMKLEGDRLISLRQDFDSILEIIRELPISATESFFSDPEKQNKGSGEIFFLSVDPQSCTGCGICSVVCPEEALVMIPQTDEEVSRLRTLFHLWEELPDTSFETIRRVHQNPDYPSLAAILLCRNFYMTMVGGSASKRGSSEKTILHLITATAESIIQPQIVAQVKEVEDLIKQLSANIHTQLGEALPKKDFQALAKTMATIPEQRLLFENFIDKLGSEEKLTSIEIGPLRRMTGLVQSLQDLHWTLTEGPTGLGRSRLGMTMATNPTRQFPDNPFCFPLILQGDYGASDLTLGLFQGHLRHFLDNIRLIRRARLEAEEKYDPDLHNSQIAALDWSDLTEEEWATLPPIFLAGDTNALFNQDLSSLSSLFSSQWPLKIIIFESSSNDEESSPEAYVADVSKVALFAMTHRKTFVLQSSTATPDHLFSGLVAGIKSRRPALFHCQVPNYEKENDLPESQPIRSQLAVQSRAFPALCFNPDGPGVFGTCLDLKSNPDPKHDWSFQEFQSIQDGEENSEQYPITFADWAFTQKRFNRHFTPFPDEEASLTPLDEYLQLKAMTRKKKTPFIIHPDQENRLQKFAVSEEMVRATESILATWNTLQELGGLVTPFTEQVREEIKEELAAEHQAAIDQLKLDFETKLEQQKDELMQITKHKLRKKLLALSGYQKSDYTN